MDSVTDRDYVVMNGWSEVAAFQTIGEALQFQEFMGNLHPNKKHDLHLKRNGFVMLREGSPPCDEDERSLRGFGFIMMKGGGIEHGRRKEGIPSDQSGWPRELS
ncbi:MAG: hypothetical protein WCI20_00360 [bacterium]